MIKKTIPSQFKINILAGISANVANVLITLISYPSYLHFLGYEKYGVWIVLSTILTFTQLSNLGIGTAVVKFVAEEHGLRNYAGIQSYVTTAIFLLTVTGLSAFFLILLFKTQIVGMFNLSVTNTAVSIKLLPYMALLSVYVFIVQVFSATLSGIGRIDLANYSDTCGRVLALVVSVSLLALGWGLESLIFGSMLSYLFIHVSTLYLIYHQIPLRILRISNVDSLRLKKMLSIGGGMFGSSLISILLGPFNKLLLSRYVGVSVVPLYEIAFNGAMQLRSLIESGLRAVSPEISRLSGNMNYEAISKINDMNRKAVRLIWLYGAPFFVLLIFLLDPLLMLWLGKRYVDTLPFVFRIMLAGTFFSLLGVPSYYILLGLGQTKQIFIAHVIQSCINAALALLLLYLGFKLSVLSVSLFATTGMVIAHISIVQQKRMVIKSYLAKIA